MPRGVWYSLYTADSAFSIGKNYTFPAPLNTIPLFVRGGCVLPVQEPSLTTTLSREKPFSLLVALDEQENAKGELYWDDGDSLGIVFFFFFLLINMINFYFCIVKYYICYFFQLQIPLKQNNIISSNLM